VLDVRNVLLDGSRPGRGDDALQVVGFAGDATRDASYSTLDLQRLQRVLGRLDAGFGEWPLVDPAVIGDVSGNARFDSADALIFFREINGIDRPEIPPIPSGTQPLQFAGADPLVSLPSTLTARAGERISVPVNLDTAQGLESVQLRLAWDPATLELLEVRRGTLTGGFQWFIQRSEPGRLVIDTSALNALTGGSGSLVVLAFQVSAGARPGAQLIDLQWARLNDSHLTLNPAPQDGLDPTDAVLHVTGPHPSAGRLAEPAAQRSATPTAQLGTRRAAPALPPGEVTAPAGGAAAGEGAPVIDWSTTGTPLPTVQADAQKPTWRGDFVNDLGKSEKQRKPNSGLRIPVARR
jgi:hypothetical protein